MEILVVSPTSPHYYLSPLTAELSVSRAVKPVSRQPLWVCAVLEEAGFSLQYLPLQDLYPLSCPPEREREHLKQRDCEVMVLSPELLTSTSTYPICGRIAHTYKELNPSGKVVLTGDHASTLPEATLTELEVDVIAPFEFLLNREYAASLLEALLRDKEPSCKGIWFKSNGRIRQQPEVSPVVEELSALPPPSYSLLSPYSEEISRGDRIWVDVLTSRGCPFRCAFCSSIPAEEFHRIRYQSPGGVAAEIDEIRRAFGNSNVFWEGIYDELYAFDIEHLQRMNKVFEEKDVKFSLVFGRCSPFSRDIAHIISNHSEGVIFGAETCNQTSLDLLHKGQTFEQVITASRIAKESSLTTVLQWIVGLPGETTSTIHRCLATINRLYASGLADRIDIQMLVPFPWTDIYKNPERIGLHIESREWEEYTELGSYPVYSTDTLTRQQIWSYFLYAHLISIYGRVMRKYFKQDLSTASQEECVTYFEERPEDSYNALFIKNLFDHGGLE